MYVLLSACQEMASLTALRYRIIYELVSYGGQLATKGCVLRLSWSSMCAALAVPQGSVTLTCLPTALVIFWMFVQV